MKTKFISEIGINYAYGNKTSEFVENAKKLIDLAYLSGCTYVKFQKRNPDKSVPEDQKGKLKKVPWEDKEITYLQYKKDIELSENDYKILYNYAYTKKLIMFSSAWDEDSVDFLINYNRIIKIPSAHLTNYDLLKYCQKKSDFRLLSTGMSKEKEIEKAVKIFKPHVLFHTNSAYPSPVDELYLEYITHLKKKYPKVKIGYSGHEYGISATLYAIVLGCEYIERHITLSHDLWGSDQQSSLSPRGIFEIKDKIAELNQMMGGNADRVAFPSELEKRKSLRKNTNS